MIIFGQMIFLNKLTRLRFRRSLYETIYTVDAKLLFWMLRVCLWDVVSKRETCTSACRWDYTSHLDNLWIFACRRRHGGSDTLACSRKTRGRKSRAVCSWPRWSPSIDCAPLDSLLGVFYGTIHVCHRVRSSLTRLRLERVPQRKYTGRDYHKPGEADKSEVKIRPLFSIFIISPE